MDSLSKYHIDQKVLDEEKGIIARSKDDPRQFEVLYKRYFEDIFRFLYQRLDDKDTAKDLVQQVFIKALSQIGKYQDKGLPIRSWFYRIAVNELNQFFRKSQKVRCVNVESESLGELMDEVNENGYEPYYEKLSEVMGMMEPENILLIEMRFFEKRSFKEIAEILAITENNAKVKVYRLLDKIKLVLTKVA